MAPEDRRQLNLSGLGPIQFSRKGSSPPEMIITVEDEVGL